MIPEGAITYIHVINSLVVISLREYQWDMHITKLNAVPV